MKMTSRERAMLIALLVIALIVGSYYLIITPQLDKYDKLKTDQADYRIQVKAVENDLANAAAIRKGVDEMLAKIDVDTKTYFPSILTEKLLIMLNDLFIQSGLAVNGAVFSEPAPVQALASAAPIAGTPTGQALSLSQIQDKLMALEPEPATSGPKPTPTPKPVVPVDPAQLQSSLASLTSMTVTLQFTAPYESLTGFITRMEALGRTIAITNLTSSQLEDGTVTGSMDLVIYALPKITGQKDPYVEWSFTSEYGKPNPFAALGYDMTVGVLNFVTGQPNIMVSVPSIAKAAVLSGTSSTPTEIELIVEKSGTGYACRTRIGTAFYPAGGTALTRFAPEGSTLRVVVNSSLRTGASDLSGATLIVHNRTDRPVQVNVVGDDPTRPRITIGTLEGSVTVR
ncbi:MAG TPA: hypothetical protein VIL27_08840 [Clostridia bacterium]